MSERAHIRSEWRQGAGDALLAENAALTERLRRLAPVLAGMVHDLAQARRENAALKRENVRLQALVAGSAHRVGHARAGRIRTR